MASIVGEIVVKLIAAIFMLSLSFSALASNCETDHWVDSVSDDGEIVKLEDGSIWQVDLADRVDSALWLPTTDIVACDDKLINTDDNETVSATRLGQPGIRHTYHPRPTSSTKKWEDLKKLTINDVTPQATQPVGGCNETRRCAAGYYCMLCGANGCFTAGQNSPGLCFEIKKHP